MREMYARGYHDAGDVEATVGIEVRPGDDVEQATIDAKDYAARGLGFGGSNHDAVVRFIEVCVKEHYPDRAYFIETEEAGRGVQVYDPRNFVKERCACTGQCD
jgi:hypothetical protein